MKTSRDQGGGPTVVAIEVSQSYAKLLAGTATPYRIERVAAIIPPAEDLDNPTAALRRLLDAHASGAPDVGVVLARDAFSLQVLELPSVDEKELASILELQLGKLTPYPRADILSAWTILGRFREGYTSVALAIARKTLVEELLSTLQRKGIAARWITVSTEGLAGWWGRYAAARTGEPGELTALVDLDTASTDCAVFAADRQLVFAHSVPSGTSHLTTPVAQQRWLGDLERLPRLLLHESVRGRLARAVFTGRLAGLEELVERLGGQWGIPLERVDALEPFDPSADVRQRVAEEPMSFTALAGCLAGGALPRIDLTPPEARVSQMLRRRAQELTRCAVSAMAVVVLVALLCVERIVILQQHLADVRDRLSRVEGPATTSIRRQQLMRDVHQWLTAPRSALRLLDHVAGASDAQITVRQLTMDASGPVTIRGSAETMGAAFAFIDRLEAGDVFSAVHARSVAKAKGRDAAGAEFEIVCEWAGS